MKFIEMKLMPTLNPSSCELLRRNLHTPSTMSFSVVYHRRISEEDLRVVFERITKRKERRLSVWKEMNHNGTLGSYWGNSWQMDSNTSMGKPIHSSIRCFVARSGLTLWFISFLQYWQSSFFSFCSSPKYHSGVFLAYSAVVNYTERHCWGYVLVSLIGSWLIDAYSSWGHKQFNQKTKQESRQSVSDYENHSWRTFNSMKGDEDEGSVYCWEISVLSNSNWDKKRHR